jgi:hypothetical protein
MIPFQTMTAFPIMMWVKDDKLLNAHGEAYIWYGEHTTGAIGITNFYDSLMYWVGNTTIAIPYNEADRTQSVKLTLVYGNRTMSAYKNNVLVGRKTNVTFNIAHTTAAIARHWWIEPNGTYGTSTRFQGSIDEVRIYNYALTPAQITTVASLSSMEDIQCYPNPVKDWMTIQYPAAATRLNVVNEFGQIVKQLPTATTGEMKINVEELANGVYFLQINEVRSLKFIKL